MAVFTKETRGSNVFRWSSLTSSAAEGATTLECNCVTSPLHSKFWVSILLNVRKFLCSCPAQVAESQCKYSEPQGPDKVEERCRAILSNEAHHPTSESPSKTFPVPVRRESNYLIHRDIIGCLSTSVTSTFIVRALRSCTLFSQLVVSRSRAQTKESFLWWSAGGDLA